LDNLEQLAAAYAKLREQTHGDQVELARLAVRIVDVISSPSFAFPIKEEALASSGTTTYTYQNNATYPALFDFLAELLHTKVPIVVESAKFGPGEILVNKEKRGRHRAWAWHQGAAKAGARKARRDIYEICRCCSLI
jgi:hypothetical protein